MQDDKLKELMKKLIVPVTFLAWALALRGWLIVVDNDIL